MDAEKPARKWEIYTLSDPRDGAVRYVGVTHYGTHRFRNHVSEAHRGRRGHKCNWIRSLIAVGLEPKHDVVDTGTGDDWKAAEIRWIRRHREGGADLTNATDGGQGMLGLSPSAETRAKQSAALKGKPVGPYSLERIAACRAGRKTYKHSPETLDKMRRVWDSPEYRAKQAAAHVGKKRWPNGRVFSKKHRANMSAATKGRKVAPDVLAARLGKKHGPLSAEHIAKIRAANLGQRKTAEARAKMSAAKTGKPWSVARRAAEEIRRMAK